MQEIFFRIRSFFPIWRKKISFLAQDWHFLLLFGLSIFSLFFSLWASHAISKQNDFLVESAAVGDIMHKILPLWDLSFFFIFGAGFLIAVGTLYFIFCEPHHLPYAIFAYAFFFLIRGVCISLTHIGIPPDHIPPAIGSLGKYFFEDDLFFSGHTGVPFLAALFLWKRIFWRYFFLLGSMVMAFTVLTMRLHYSIDIVGAYFITYGIFHIAQKFWDMVKKTSWIQDIEDIENISSK